MEEKLKELQEKGIVSFYKWERISNYQSKTEVKIRNTKIDMFSDKWGVHFQIGDMRFFRLKEVTVKTGAELFGLNSKEDGELYLAFINYKDELIAYIPLEESETE